MKQQKPILHGRDHIPGGADPIPGLPGMSAVAGDFAGVVVAIPDLVGYWRLGESSSPFADTSGVAPACDMATAGFGVAATPDVTGALATGDDGAVEFNYDGTVDVGGTYLACPNLKDFDFDTPPGEMTAAVWVKVKASALSRRGVILGNSSLIAGSPDYSGGWGLQVVYPGRTIRMVRGHTVAVGEKYAESPSGVVAGEWVFVTGTYDGSTIRLYMNAELVDEQADTTAANTINAGCRIGWGYAGGGHAWFYGTADEAAVWSRALTATEIATLYSAGVATGSEGGEVLVSDGNGGWTAGKVTPAAVEPGSDGQVLTTVGAAVEWADPASGSGGAAVTDTHAWMPLSTVVAGVPDFVWDGDDQLIPTLTDI